VVWSHRALVTFLALACGACAGTGIDPGAPILSRFETDPAGASVFIDGGFVGTTPTAFHLPAKPTVEVRLELHDHFPATARLDRRIGLPADAPAGTGWDPLYYWSLNRR
jgi:hypothetical protein